MADVPWDPLVAVIVDVLRVQIDEQQQQHAPERAGGTARARETLFTWRMLQVAPLLCREARDQWRAQPLAPWLLMYNLNVLGILHSNRSRYYDAIPSSIDFGSSSGAPPGAPHGIKIAADSRKWVSTDWLIEARRQYARAVDRGDTNPNERLYGHPNQWLATDAVPNDLPLPVRRLVGFMRFLHSRSRHALLLHAPETEAALLLQQQPVLGGGVLDEVCARKGCARTASSVPRAAQQSLEYWELCRTGAAGAQSSSPFCSDYNFCSITCEQQTVAEHGRLVHCCYAGAPAPLDAIEFLRPGRRTGARTHGERQQAAAAAPVVPTARLLQAARERNELVRRRMHRAELPSGTKHLPMSIEGVVAMRRSLVLALNVDTALLYAASILSELPKTQRPKKAMPTQAEWRRCENTRTLYLKAVLAIHDILTTTPTHQTASGTGPRTRLLAAESTQPRWLQRIKDKVLVLF